MHKKWITDGLPPIKVAINFSSIQFFEKNLVEGINNIIKEYGLNPSFLVMEITESILMKNTDKAISDIKKLQSGENVLLNSGQTLYSKDILYTLPIRKSFAYCSDTRYNESILPYIEDVDLLYHETTYAKDLKQKAFDMGHATTIEAAQMAKLAKVRQLVIGHYSSRYHELQPLLEECQEVFEHTILGVENLRIRI